MILQNLAKLYDQLLDDESVKIPQPGFSVVNINYFLSISASGELLDIIYVFDETTSGKKTVERPQKIILPEAVKRSSGIAPNLLWDNSAYVFGLADESKSFQYCKDRFEAFREHNIAFLSQLNSPETNALLNFLSQYSQEDLITHPQILAKRDEILKATGFLTFQYEPTKKLIANLKTVRKAVSSQWEDSGEDAVKAQCLITGQIAPVQRLHAAIKGVKDVQSAGGSIVSFNDRAYESYGKEQKQGLNAPVSTSAAFAYTTSLNYLLSPENPHKKLQLGDSTVVYWAESTNPTYENLFQAIIDPQWDIETSPEDEQTQNTRYDHETTSILQKIAGSIRDGLPIDFNALDENLDPSTKFHVLGLAPNAARISIRFYETAPFSKILSRLIQHHEDISMGQDRPWSVWRLLKETISPKASKQEASPLMAGAIMRSILTGLPYPMALYYAILNRVRADSDDPTKGVYKISAIKAGIIKACLLRKARQQNNTHLQEILTMSLNPQSTNQAYLLGRLFAVLEKAQEDAASPNKLNATIKDRYFTAASANPASTFPVLLRLSQHHISKSEWGRISEIRIGEIMELLDIDDTPFPKRLSLDEQGIFILGYYHQRNDFYKSKKQEPSAELESSDITQTELF
ncbi:MAG TPA: type I-C CRISPR-associated protein Cas8c/Csd1 [Anaerolineaceae bacterium]|nr:type I-C CRISPR-associated protein Cas8c/Csd1 [Anaerolineaceae bacterium]